MTGEGFRVLGPLRKRTEGFSRQEKIADVGAVELAVRSLARGAHEHRPAVALLLELSTDASARARIGKARGCILLLVTLLGNASADPDAADAAAQLLARLSADLQNTVQMAEANYFKPLVHGLLHGTSARGEPMSFSVRSSFCRMSRKPAP